MVSGVPPDGFFLFTWILHYVQDDKTLMRFGSPPTPLRGPLPLWGRIAPRHLRANSLDTLCLRGNRDDFAVLRLRNLLVFSPIGGVRRSRRGVQRKTDNGGAKKFAVHVGVPTPT